MKGTLIKLYRRDDGHVQSITGRVVDVNEFFVVLKTKRSVEGFAVKDIIRFEVLSDFQSADKIEEKKDA